MNEEFLFSQYDIFNVLEGQRQSVRKDVESLAAETVLNASEHDLVRALTEKFELHVPVLKDEESYIAETEETKVDLAGNPRQALFSGPGPHQIPGTKTVIAIPFEGGETDFFRIQPQVWGAAHPRARIGEGELLFTYVKVDHDGASIRRDHQGVMKHVRDCLMSLSQSARQFNDSLEAEIAALLSARKKRLLAHAGMVEAIGLPMKKRSGVPVRYAVPVTRRAPKIEHIHVQGSFKPEPVLAKADYEEILGIMKNMARVMELSPHAFVDMGEEALRSHFLVQLNGAYEGDAAGETFNFQGKTDILIRKDGKNVFIAECKFWKGEKAFRETVDQLLSYLSWRDTKTAVVLFNRNADFSAVLAKIAEIAPRHAHFKSRSSTTLSPIRRFPTSAGAPASIPLTIRTSASNPLARRHPAAQTFRQITFQIYYFPDLECST
jgi:hypothetical protein